MILTYTWLAVAIMALVLYLRQRYSKFSRDGVNHLPIVPFFGNLHWVCLKKEHIFDCLMRAMTTYPDDRIVGYYNLVTPLYLVRDVEAMKQITINDFQHFVDRRQFSSKFDPMFGRKLFMIHGDAWKAMRSTLSAAFTSSKIRLMVPFMEEVGKEMNKALKKKIKDSGNPYIDAETKDMNNVTASCAFGLKVNSQTVDHEFYLNSKEITRVFLRRILRMMKLSLVRRETTEYFTNVIFGTMGEREKNNIVRNDMINILAKVKREQVNLLTRKRVKTLMLVLQQLMSHTLTKYNIAMSGEIQISWLKQRYFCSLASTKIPRRCRSCCTSVQNRLLEKIREHDAKNGGQIDYNSIQSLSMTYLDMMVSEGLRLWPPFGNIDRRCVKDYNFGRPNSQATKDLIIREGDAIILVPWVFHRNPKYFPDPAKFDPDRFSPENRNKIIPFTYTYA